MANLVNKEDTIRRVAAATEFTQKDVRKVVDALRDVIYEEVAGEGTIKPFDGVTFKGVVKPASVGRNPRTGEKIDIPEKVTIKAHFGKYAKDALAN